MVKRITLKIRHGDVDMVNSSNFSHGPISESFQSSSLAS